MEGDNSLQGSPAGSLLVLTTDAKGVVMRPEGLREQTKKAAAQEKHKLDKRMSRGIRATGSGWHRWQKVYTVEPNVRTAEEVVGGLKPSGVEQKKRRNPRPENKRVWASVERGSVAVLEEMFHEGQDRDKATQKAVGGTGGR